MDCRVISTGSQGFLSTLSLRRATKPSPRSIEEFQISIHALLAESDINNLLMETAEMISIHALLAESDADERAYHQLAPISIHALLAESDYFSAVMRQNPGISIHALLAESDNNINNSVTTADKISIHALLAESDAAGRLSVILII